MKNVKDQVGNALLTVTDNVTDSYPASWANLPAIQYVEEENRVHERVGNREGKSYVRFRVDIWHSQSTSDTAMKVDEAISDIGLVRIACQDVPDPSGLKHKVMRYEGILDMKSNIVFWNN